jgi:hypothetical protein
MKTGPDFPFPLHQALKSMNRPAKPVFKAVGVFMLMLASGMAAARADITVRLSVKFIHNLDPANTGPGGNIGTAAGFAAEVDYANQVLDATGTGFRVSVLEYLDIRPQPPAGQSSGYWFTLPARENKLAMETGALADKATWRWNTGAINIYVNNTTSGQCSFVGSGSTITLGGTVSKGTVLHEIGHIFNLRHTHTGDYDTTPNPADGVFTSAHLADGDLLPETSSDNANISTRNQLSQALFSIGYASGTDAERRRVDSAFENVMSYHEENTLLPVQMDLWASNANGGRLEFCNGRTWFTANGGNDSASGDNANAPFESITKSLGSLVSPNDVVLMRGGNYSAPPGGTITAACTLRATRGPVTVTR